MAQKTGKYAYNRNYYENLRSRSVYEGNAVRKLDTATELYDEEYEDEQEYEKEYADPQPLRRGNLKNSGEWSRERSRETGEAAEPRARLKWKIDINLGYTLTMVAAVCALLVTSFLMLETRSDIIQTEKKISIAKNELADVTALNESLKASLDTQMDRNYIYSMAVGRLGMVYPNDNEKVTYEPADGGYVRQMSQIP
ncbi:MAG: septum formation initiator family protein [Lachnospiraceae bacterium]|nr:septum formation initiator family protein [Lachnospiraceae bacterium]